MSEYTLDQHKKILIQNHTFMTEKRLDQAIAMRQTAFGHINQTFDTLVYDETYVAKSVIQ